VAPVRVALVGYGLAGRVFHAPFIEATAGVELAAIVTSDPERRAQAAAAHPGAVLFGKAEALWAGAADLGVELAVVATPNRSHLPVALAALGAGLGVVVDKPLAATAEDGRRIVAEAERRRLFLSVFHNRRWDGDFLTVRRLIGAGDLGEVWRFESRYERWQPDRKPGAWRERADAEEGGGLLADLGSHLIDQAIVLFGPPVSVRAELHRRRAGAEVDDDTFVALEHQGGTTSHLWASSVTARSGPRFRVLGSTAGYVVWGMDPQERALRAGQSPGHAGWGESPPGRWGTIGAGDDDTAPVPTEIGNYGRFYEGVVAAMSDGRPPPVAPADASLTLEVIAAARRSAALGRPVARSGE
jgi:predicted dehydrogenase